MKIDINELIESKEEGIKEEIVKEVYDDKEFTIEDRCYKIPKITYLDAEDVLATVTKYQQMPGGILGNLNTPEIKGMMSRRILRKVNINGVTLDKKHNHFDDHMSDYIPFVMITLAVFIYPLGAGLNTG